MNATRSRWLTAAVLLFIMAAGAAYRLQIAHLDMESLLQRYLQDDAFYYYTIAKFVNAMHVVTFDGTVVTNGFHPLWLAIILPFFKVADNAAVIHILYFITILGTLTILTVYLAAVRLTANTPLSLAAAAVFALDAPIVWLHFNGMETSLNSLLLMLFLLSCFSVFSAAPVSRCKLLLFGVISALLFLVRTDNAIVLVACYLPLLWRAYRTQRWLDVVLPTAVCTALCAPWLLWNVVTFHEIVQVSGQVGSSPGDLIQPEIQQTVMKFIAILYFFCMKFGDLVHMLVYSSPTPSPLSALSVTLSIGVFLLYQRRRMPRNGENALLFFVFGILTIFAYHAGVRMYVRTWYFAPLTLVVVLVTPLALSALARLVKPKYQTITSVFLACVWTALVVYFFPPIARHSDPAIRQTLHLPAWLNEHTPPDAILGSSNTGIFSYFTQRTFVNLDGVVDEYAFRARKNNDLPSYLHQRHVRYTVDTWGSQQFACQENPWYACKEVYRYGGDNPGLVMELVPHTAAP